MGGWESKPRPTSMIPNDKVESDLSLNTKEYMNKN